MQLMLYRSYAAEGVNGELFLNGARLCYTIELPWLNNKPNRSCIPEGTYALRKRWSRKYSWHLEVTGVKGRSLILIHPANDALRELRGCIAPVTAHTGQGKGVLSRPAFEKLKGQVLPVLKRETVMLTILRIETAATG